MPTLIYTDALVTINAIDLSDHCRSVQLNYEAEILDDTAMGTSGTRSNRPGLKNWTLTVEFYQDFAAASVDARRHPEQLPRRKRLGSCSRGQSARRAAPWRRRC